MGGAFDGLHQKMRAVGLFIYIPKNQSTRFSHNILVQIKNGMAGRQPASVFRKE